MQVYLGYELVNILYLEVPGGDFCVSVDICYLFNILVLYFLPDVFLRDDIRLSQWFRVLFGSRGERRKRVKVSMRGVRGEAFR